MSCPTIVHSSTIGCQDDHSLHVYYFSPETSEIAKPSELLNSIRAYMNVLQCVENYVNIAITRVFNNVMLQQTQQAASSGDSTIASRYTQWYSDILLR